MRVLLIERASGVQRMRVHPAGAFNKATRRTLNQDIDSDITELARSLERWRWMQRELGGKHIFVNIPDYRVEVRDGANTVMSK